MLSFGFAPNSISSLYECLSRPDWPIILTFLTQIKDGGMERKHYLDQLRAILMFLGVPYHAGLIYSSNLDWTVSSHETSQILTWACQFAHTFRMPAFMLIAGFFALVMIRKQGEVPWIRSRFVRLGVPLLSVGLLVNPFQMLAKAVALNGVPGAWDAWMLKLSSPGGHWVQQLWFLIDLLIYSSLLAFAWRHGDKLRLAPLCRGSLTGSVEAPQHSP